jgi:hypothetical protein
MLESSTVAARSSFKERGNAPRGLQKITAL